ncbi:hypothetical protein BH20PSE1_BH20PSE1_01680 [soil metagenome]
MKVGYPGVYPRISNELLPASWKCRPRESLKVPPGNRLEKLSGHRADQYSIRINDQWRVGFVWRDGDADDVETVDYH